MGRPIDVRWMLLDEEVELLVIETPAAATGVNDLTDAEAEVATLLADGHDEQTIAKLRGTPPEEVGEQRRAIFEKLGVQTAEELAAALFG